MVRWFWMVLLAAALLPSPASARGARRGPPTLPGEPVAWVTNPTSGVKLAVYAWTPKEKGEFPVLVFAPGGIQDGTNLMRPPDLLRYLRAGFAVVTFDPDGRGRSGGTDDLGGRVHQDGLAAVLAWAADEPSGDDDPRRRFDRDRIGLVSLSYGITMASGALARHRTPARFLIDWEGPANRTFSAGCGRDLDYGPAHRIPWGDCSDEKWWAEREADRFIGDVPVAYQRVQREKDHAQPDFAHTLDMVEKAEAGGVPWVRLNDDPPGKRYASLRDIRGLPVSRDVSAYIARYAVELVEMTTKEKVVPVEDAELPRPGGGTGGRRPPRGPRR